MQMTGYAVGANSIIIKTTDGGGTWNAINPFSSGTLYGVYFSDVNTGTVVGDNGLILRTTDGGGTWTQQQSGVGISLRGVFFSGGNKGVIVGLGNILRTTNGGTVWISKPSNNLYRVSFADANNGFAVGYNDKILRTTDGGQSWASQSFIDGINFTAVACPNPSTAVAVGFQVTAVSIAPSSYGQPMEEKIGMKNHQYRYSPLRCFFFRIRIPVLLSVEKEAFTTQPMAEVYLKFLCFLLRMVI